MTLGQFQAMIDAAKQQAESGGEVNVNELDFELETTQPLGTARIDDVAFLNADGAKRFKMVVTLMP